MIKRKNRFNELEELERRYEKIKAEASLGIYIGWEAWFISN